MANTENTLEDLDNIIAQAHAAAVAALAKAEQDLAKLTIQRDQLADRVARLRLALPPGPGSELHSNEAPAEIPAVEVTSPEEEAEPAPSPERNLWDDVFKILSGRRRAIQTKEILRKLIAMGWHDSEALKNKLANAFSRWTLQGKLERRGRGLYRLASGEVDGLVDDAAAITPAEKSTTVAITPVKNTPVMTAPVKTTPSKRTPAAKSPKRNLWEDVQSILADQRAIRTTEILEKLTAMGWRDSETTKHKLANSISRWTRQGKLEKRGRRLYKLAPLAPENTPAAITPVKTTSRRTTSAENTPAAAKSPRRNIWEDVQSILSGGAVKTSDLFTKLVELGHPDSESAKKNLHMATARWTRRGMLEKLGRGLYGLASAETETGTEVVETEIIPADSAVIESAKAEEMPTVEAVPSKSSKEPLPATPESMSPQPEDLWNAVRQILRRGQPVKAAVIVDTLNQKGWDFRSPEDRDEVYEVLRVWSKQGHLLWGRAGVVVVG